MGMGKSKKHCIFENPCLTNNELHFGKIISEKKHMIVR